MTEPLSDASPVVDVSPTALARMLMDIIKTDRPRLERIDRYVAGDHDMPYMPQGADEEYKKLAERAITNMIPLVLRAPSQTMYVDSFRRGTKASRGESGARRKRREIGTGLPEWEHWQSSRLDARQIPIHSGALKYGHSFALTYKDARTHLVQTKGLSALVTAAVYEDSANDIDPYAALTIVRAPVPGSEIRAARRGLAKMWDGRWEYDVTYASLDDLDSIRVRRRGLHGLGECPVTRFAAMVDLEGRTVGVVEPIIPLQDRINQTVFDLLVAQTYGSFKIRTVTGMAPPMMRWTPDMLSGEVKIGITPPEGTQVGDPIIDPKTGKPIPEPINLNARRFFFAQDHRVQFGVLDATSLEGYIKSLDMSLRHLSVITQIPPYYLLGEIANLSAEALQAAEAGLLRKCEEFKKSFGESWERVFRLAGALSGISSSAHDYAGEVIWRNMEMRSMSGTADALVKLKELGIPVEGLWSRVPETTRTEIEEWLEMRQELIDKLKEMGVTQQPQGQQDQGQQGRQPLSALEGVVL